jgi:hypothetical protein
MCDNGSGAVIKEQCWPRHHQEALPNEAQAFFLALALSRSCSFSPLPPPSFPPLPLLSFEARAHLQEAENRAQDDLKSIYSTWYVQYVIVNPVNRNHLGILDVRIGLFVYLLQKRRQKRPIK